MTITGYIIASTVLAFPIHYGMHVINQRLYASWLQVVKKINSPNMWDYPPDHLYFCWFFMSIIFVCMPGLVFDRLASTYISFPDEAQFLWHSVGAITSFALPNIAFIWFYLVRYRQQWIKRDRSFHHIPEYIRL